MQKHFLLLLMPIFELNNEIAFPPPYFAEEDGLLAIGGDLSVERILCAYKNGIFPWFNPEDPILWWSPDPRCVLFPHKFKISKSLQKLLYKNVFEVSFNTCFSSVIENCANVSRSEQPGTWITPSIIEAYTRLHQLGWAHSVEVFQNGRLVGGLYGLAIGKIFYGESMFHLVSDASKVALFYWVEFLKERNFELIDNQTTTNHLLSLGAEEIDRKQFLDILEQSTNSNEKLIIC